MDQPEGELALRRPSGMHGAMARATKPPRIATRRPQAPAALLRPKGRTLDEFLPLRRCEQRLLEACRKGTFAELNGGNRPEEKPADEQDRLRPGFVRFLCLGGDEQAPVHEKGVQIQGGWIDGDLDLQACILPNNVGIHRSTIDGDIVLRDAAGEGINLTGSRINGLRGDRLELKGSLFLKGYFSNADGVEKLIAPFQASGEVRLLGAKIGGNLTCRGGRFENKDGIALGFDRADIGGSCSLNVGFQASGEVRLPGAKIGGNLVCIGGSFENKDGFALHCDNAVVTGSFFLFEVTSFSGSASLSNLSVGALIDDEASWTLGKAHILDGFRYHFIADGPTDAESRIRWLERQHSQDLSGKDFRPQPWQQLISTLRRMGHGAEADEVAIAFQDQRRKAGRVRTPIGRLLHWSFGLLAGYGYKPIRLLKVMLGVWFACGWFYWAAAAGGGLGPTNPLVFDNPKFAHCRPDPPTVTTTGQKRVGNWYWCPAVPAEYTAFQPFLYSLDLILPLVELQQDRDWAALIPSPRTHDEGVGWSENLGRDAHRMTTNWSWGQWARVVMWFEILFGWIASLLLVAVLTGLTNREGKGEA